MLDKSIEKLCSTNVWNNELSLIGSCASRWINPYLADHLVRCPMQLQRLYVDDERTQLSRRNLQLRNGDWTRFFLPSSLSIPARESYF